MFEESESATRDARKLAERDVDYRDNKQLTPDQIRKLEKRGQPPVIFNRIQRKTDFLSGIEKQQRKDPKAFPRNPDDEDAANAATDSIRYVCDDEDWDDKRSAAWDDLVTPGTCAILVGHKETKDGVDPALFQIAWDRYFYDPYSARPDFSDKRYDGIVTWYDLEDAAGKWPDKRDALESTIASERNSETYDDKPKHSIWADAKRQRVRVIEMYYLKGKQWMRCVFTKSGHLEDPQPSPYVDEDGKPENPIKAMSLYVDRDNNRFGAVRVMIDPQDEINKRRSKGLHLITMRQSRVSLSAAADKEIVRRELAKPDGVISADKDDFEILPTNDMARGNFEMLLDAKAEIDLLGANAALAGKNENDMSGRAILAQQQGGMVEVARMFDRLRSLSIDVYRAIWNRIRQFWPNERWVRVTDEEKNLRFVGLNQKITVAMLAQEVMQGDEAAMQKAAQLVGPKVLQAAMQGDQQAQAAVGMFVQQNGEQVVEVRNAVNELDVDIVVDEGMDTPSVQAEQFEIVAKLLPGIVSLPPAYAKILIQASQFRGKDQMIEALDEMMQQGNPAEAQAQAETKAEEAKLQLTAKIKAAELEQTGQLKREEMQQEATLTREKMALDAKVKIEAANADAETSAQIESQKLHTQLRIADEKNRVETERQEKETMVHSKADAVGEQTQMLSEVQKQMQALTEALHKMGKPKRKIPIRDAAGLIVELREVTDE